MTQVIICTPEALCDAANALMCVLGSGPEEGGTFASLGFSHDSGAYSLAAFRASDDWLLRLTAPLVAPEWKVDLDGAEYAQAALEILDMSGAPEIPELRPDAILVLLSASGREVLDLLGLRRADDEDIA
jgi:hypothetical protein